MILFWCTFFIILDGYDLAIYGAVLPVLIEEWGLSNVEAGAMGSYGLIGVMIGAIFFGPLADKIGRNVEKTFHPQSVMVFCRSYFQSSNRPSFVEKDMKIDGNYYLNEVSKKKVMHWANKTNNNQN